MKTTNKPLSADDLMNGSALLVLHEGGNEVCIEAAADDTGASLPRFRMVAYTGAPLELGYRHPVVVDLEGVKITAQSLPVRFQHSPYTGVGHTERIAVENGQLIAEGVVSRDTLEAREIVTSGKRGFPWQASIGAKATKVEYVEDGVAFAVNGRRFDGPMYIARESELGEISIVDRGADNKTSTKIAAMSGGSEKELTMDPETTKDNVATEAVEEVKAAADTNAPDPVQIMREGAAAETKRIAEVRAVCAGTHADIEARAIGEGWSRDRTELEVLRADRPKAPAAHVHDNVTTNAVLEAACMLSANRKGAEASFDEQTLEAASKRFKRGLGLQELLLEAAWANGYTGRMFRDTREILRHAFGANIQAAFSTVDMAGILSNVANKSLLDGFFTVEGTWRDISSRRSVKDFKTVTSYRLTGTDQYEKVAPTGELKHGTLGEESFTNKADTYGLMLAVSRTDIINDDLGAITTVPRKLGRGAGLKLNDVFWTEFLANSSFFASGYSNYLAGADTALSVDALTLAEALFLDQTDADGKPIAPTPAILLTPTALSATAAQLMKSAEIRNTTASTEYATANPHAGKFRPVVSRYLGNSSYTGYSSAAWYLLADPADLSVIEVAFLNGQESPTIETANADFNTLGIQMRGFHDFGVSLQDERAGVKMLGEAA